MKQVVIVGGGITGLAAAYALRRTRAHVTLIEARDRLGGTIVTERRDGFLIEGGPDAFIVQKPWGLELCRELGLEGDLVPAARRTVHVFSKGRLHPLPDGMVLTVPTRTFPLFTSSLLSAGAKFRMLTEIFRPRGTAGDESLASFVRRRFGREALEKIAEPLMAGIFVTPAERLSLRATFPRLLDLEREHRSLILAMRRLPAGGSPFRTLRGGMDKLVEALTDALKDAQLIHGTPVRRIRRRPRGARVEFEGGEIHADELVLACPGPVAAQLVREDAPDLAEQIGAIPYVSTATISLGYLGLDCPGRFDGTGFVVPRAERRRILACTWSSKKFEGRAPEGALLVRCFVGGVEQSGLVDWTDEDLVRLAQDEIRHMMGIESKPEIARVFRWKETNPVYEVGHLERVRAVERLLGAWPGLHVAGAAYRGVGIPDCIHSGRRVADSILSRM